MLFDLNLCATPETNDNDLGKLVDRVIHFGEVYFTSNGDWSLHDLLEELLKHFSHTDVYISTYSITEYPARRLSAFRDNGSIRSMRVLLDREFEKRYPKVNQLMQSICDEVGYAKVHAKILVLQTAHCSITVLGSANWTVNPRLEAGVMTTDKQVAEDFKTKITSLIDDAE